MQAVVRRYDRTVRHMSPIKIAHSREKHGPPGSQGPNKSKSQTGLRSVQPFLRSLLVVCPAHKQTHRSVVSSIYTRRTGDAA